MNRVFDFIKKIISIRLTDDGLRYCITILGIKIKYPRPEVLIKKRSNPFYKYKKENRDITKLPKAEGELREIQLANLELLKELDYVCNQNGLQYWINFGTLLGAVRHKGFIPWDDDIDVSMMREDYKKVIDAFKKSTRNSDIYADYVYLGKGSCIIKVMHKKCPLLFVDIFPCDFIDGNSDYDSRLNITKQLKDYRLSLSHDKSINTREKVNAKVDEFNKKILKTNNESGDNISCGIEYVYSEPVWVQPYDTIFPLKTTPFEDCQIKSINKPEIYLQETFGNYMEYPENINFGHSMFRNINKENRRIIKELIRE